MELKCSICGEENVILIVPPDKRACYCLADLVPSVSKGQTPSRDEALVMVKIVEWLEERGHKIQPAPPSPSPHSSNKKRMIEG